MQKKGIQVELGLAQDATKVIADIETTLKDLSQLKQNAIKAVNDLAYWRQSLIGFTSKAEKTMMEFGRALEELAIDPKTNKKYNELFNVVQKSVATSQKIMTRIDTATEAIKQIK